MKSTNHSLLRFPCVQTSLVKQDASAEPSGATAIGQKKVGSGTAGCLGTGTTAREERRVPPSEEDVGDSDGDWGRKRLGGSDGD
jgi:hypothetical protein